MSLTLTLRLSLSLSLSPKRESVTQSVTLSLSLILTLGDARREAGAAAMLSTLLLLGAKGRARDSGGMGAVHWACRMGNLDLVKALLHAGASLNAPSGHKLMPLAEAAAEASLQAERAI